MCIWHIVRLLKVIETKVQDILSCFVIKASTCIFCFDPFLGKISLVCWSRNVRRSFFIFISCDYVTMPVFSPWLKFMTKKQTFFFSSMLHRGKQLLENVQTTTASILISDVHYHKLLRAECQVRFCGRSSIALQRFSSRGVVSVTKCLWDTLIKIRWNPCNVYCCTQIFSNSCQEFS